MPTPQGRTTRDRKVNLTQAKPTVLVASPGVLVPHVAEETSALGNRLLFEARSACGLSVVGGVTLHCGDFAEPFAGLEDRSLVGVLMKEWMGTGDCRGGEEIDVQACGRR
jgi:hypothetical protein